MKNLHNKTGFTLIEILVSLTIFAIIILTLFTTFNTATSGVETMKTSVNDYQKAQIAINRIKKDLSSLCLTLDPTYLPPDITDKNIPDRFRIVSETSLLGDSEVTTLRFASFGHLVFSQEDTNKIGIIKYYVDAQDDYLVLKRSDTGLFFFNENQENDPVKDPVLCDRILTFKVEFIGQEGDIKNTWNSDASDFGYGTPIAAKIRLEVGDTLQADCFETTILLPVVREKNDS